MNSVQGTTTNFRTTSLTGTSGFFTTLGTSSMSGINENVTNLKCSNFTGTNASIGTISITNSNGAITANDNYATLAAIATTSGAHFTDAIAGDICYKNLAGSLRLGTSIVGGGSQLQIKTSGVNVTGNQTITADLTVLGYLGNRRRINNAGITPTANDSGQCFYIGSSLTLTLPTGSSCPVGTFFTIIGNDATGTINPNGHNIAGYTLSPSGLWGYRTGSTNMSCTSTFATITIIWNGYNWVILSCLGWS